MWVLSLENLAIIDINVHNLAPDWGSTEAGVKAEAHFYRNDYEKNLGLFN